LLRRADAAVRDGAIPLQVPAGLEAFDRASTTLDTRLRALAESEGTAEVIEHRLLLQSALAQLGARFGFTAKFTENGNWLADVRKKAEADRRRERVQRLASRIQTPDHYKDEQVAAEIDQIASLGDASLKEVAKTVGVNIARKKGRAFVVEMLAQLTSVKEPIEPATRQPRKTSAKPSADPQQVQEFTDQLLALAGKVEADPRAVSDAEMQQLLNRLVGEFSDAQQKDMAKAITGAKGKSAKEARERIETKLVGDRRMQDRQNA
jgi:hypothetical protein